MQGFLRVPVFPGQGMAECRSCVSANSDDEPMIRLYPDDKDAVIAEALGLFTTFHVDILDGERFLQCLAGRFLCLTPIS
jgi:hypothetical protein